MSKHPIWFGFLSYQLSERRAIFVLVIILCLIKLLPPYFREKSSSSPFTEEDWIAFRQHIESSQPDDEPVAQDLNPDITRAQEHISFQYFDPNTVSSAQLRQWNVPERVISTWLNFRNAGATFRQPADIHRIYGLPGGLARTLEQYVRIEEKPADPIPISTVDSVEQVSAIDSDTQQIIPATPIIIALDINSSSEADWTDLPGIGPAYAGRILRFREALGGFSSIEQIGETWNLPDTVFQKIKPFLIASAPFRQLPINEIPVEDLAAHPYISNKQATVLHRFRKNYGPFLGPEMLQKTGVLTESDISRLLPYIQF